MRVGRSAAVILLLLQSAQTFENVADTSSDSLVVSESFWDGLMSRWNSLFDANSTASLTPEKDDHLASQPEPSATKPKGPEGPMLTNFCGHDLGDTAYHMSQNETQKSTKRPVVDCSCCGTQHIRSLESQAVYYYGGTITRAPAQEIGADGKRINAGQVLMWSLGEKVPRLLCDRQTLNCECQDENWKEEDVTCLPAKPCRFSPRGPSENPSADATHYTDDRTLSSGKEDCESGPSGLRRVSMGRQRCQDVAANQCKRVFAYKEDAASWYTCEAGKVTRTCPMNIIRSVQEKLKQEKVMQEWVAERLYDPDLEWELIIDNFGIIHQSEVPTRETVVSKLQPLVKERSQAM